MWSLTINNVAHHDRYGIFIGLVPRPLHYSGCQGTDYASDMEVFRLKDHCLWIARCHKIYFFHVVKPWLHQVLIIVPTF